MTTNSNFLHLVSRRMIMMLIFLGSTQFIFASVNFTEAASSSEDSLLVDNLLANREMIPAEEVYQSSFYGELLQHQKAHDQKLINQEEIAVLNTKLKKLAGDIEKQSSEKSKDKLRLKESDLKAQRAHLELQDAPTLSYYTQAEFLDVQLKASALYNQNKSQVLSRPMLVDLCNSLFSQSDQNMSEATQLYTDGVTIANEADRSTNSKLAFAKEALGIAQMQQVVSMMQNLEVMLQYSNDELLAFRGEKPRDIIHSTSVAPAAEPVAEVVALEEKEVIKDDVAEVMPEPIAVSAPEATTAAIVEETIPETKAAESAPVAEIVKETPKEEVVKEEPVVLKTMVKKEVKPIDSNVCSVNEEADQVFFTIQVGAFSSKPDESQLKSLGTVCVDNSDSRMTKFVFGRFDSVEAARAELDKVKASGYPDAFITAYVNGARVKVAEASNYMAKAMR